jgi:acetolactate synthase-1/2/3 large subunit
MKAAELIIKCLENEGVDYIFGLPGEENIELLEPLASSKIRFVLARDERGAAFMANAWGRLSGSPGVCLSTLGPGATNMVTGIADAYLDFAPVVAITAQKSANKIQKEAHQYIDILSMLKPITKWNTRIENAEKIPEMISTAFSIAAMEKLGPVHLEIPEDINALPAEERISGPVEVSYPAPSDRAISQAIEAIMRSRQPIILAGNGVIRANASGELAEFSRKLRIPVATTFMGMGAMPADDELFISTIGLQSKDYISCGLEKADLIIAVGYDPVEFSREYWDGDKKTVYINSVPDINGDSNAVEVTGDIRKTLLILSERLSEEKDPSYFLKIKGFAERIMECSVTGFPLKPMRIIKDIRKVLGREDILISDVGAHKIWIGRFYPAFKENTVIISNGLASMGFALPAAISAKLLYPERKVIAAVGDGGFMMSMPEIETAIRLGVSFVCLIFNDGGLGLIEWKERLRYKKDFFVKFNNPDFVKLAEAFGAKGYRASSENDLLPILEDALAQKVPSIIDCPVDYSENLRLSEKLGGLICPM